MVRRTQPPPPWSFFFIVTNGSEKTFSFVLKLFPSTRKTRVPCLFVHRTRAHARTRIVGGPIKSCYNYIVVCDLRENASVHVFVARFTINVDAAIVFQPTNTPRPGSVCTRDLRTFHIAQRTVFSQRDAYLSSTLGAIRVRPFHSDRVF